MSYAEGVGFAFIFIFFLSCIVLKASKVAMAGISEALQRLLETNKAKMYFKWG